MRSIYFRLSVETLKKLKEEGKDLENLKRITDSRKIFKALFPQVDIGNARTFRVFFPKTDIEDVEILERCFPEMTIRKKIPEYTIPRIDAEEVERLKRIFPEMDAENANMFKDVFPGTGTEKILEEAPPKKATALAKPPAGTDIIFKIVYGETDVITLKKGSVAFARAYAPFVRLIEIPSNKFLCFLIILGAENKRWMLRFWDLREERAVAVGRDHPSLYDAVLGMLSANKRLHDWGGVEVTPLKAKVPKVKTRKNARVGLYRYPTASISVRKGSENRISYRQIERIWENLLIRV